MRVLRTPLCTLEPLVASHARDMFVVLGDPAIYAFENAPPPSEAWLTERYRMLETRRSPDQSERWLNWVVRMASGDSAGFVQATVRPDRTAFVAYVLNSEYWRRGIASSAVSAMLEELRCRYGVGLGVAVLKSANVRSLALLKRLEFAPASPQQTRRFEPDADELLMVKALAGPDHAH